MMKILISALFLSLHIVAYCFSNEEVRQWKKQASQVTIIRDNWGVPHVYGKTDADVVFGLMYAQCEDNYWQMEETFVSSLGREAELYGEERLPDDMTASLFRVRSEAKRLYTGSDQFIKQLCTAAADGINYYLFKHPGTERRLLKRYEPWYFLIPGTSSPSDHGITSREIQRVMKVNLKDLSEGAEDRWIQQTENGSNMFAIAPSKSVSGKSMLLINPHVGFFGNGQRYECHLVTEKGMNVSGFAMFGNFWIWSGFNPNIGWSHTNSGVDFTDVYLERFDHPADTLKYRYGSQYKTARVFTDTILYKSGSGLKKKVFRFMATDHGPVVAKRDSFYVTVKDATGLPPVYILQCWRMMQAKNLDEFRSALNLRALGYPNTMYADRYGNIAYWHGNAVPKRSSVIDWRYPVDGSNPETEWHGLHPLDEIIHSINPSSGFLQNCNSTPFLSAGSASPDSALYPNYMAYDPQNFRAMEALSLLSTPGKISFEQFENKVVSTHLKMMECWVPQIVKAYDNLPAGKRSGMAKLKVAMDTLRNWDCRSKLNSKATTLAVFWQRIAQSWAAKQVNPNDPFAMRKYSVAKQLPYSDSLALAFMQAATDTLENRYGTAFVNWGDINRLQRIHTSGVLEKFSDLKPSLAVRAAPSALGSLCAFSTRQNGTKKMYGTAGNSYVAVIEFGDTIRAKSIVYFGQSADKNSRHYFDQAPLYAQSKFKDAWFYKKDVMKHAERIYHPGE